MSLPPRHAPPDAVGPADLAAAEEPGCEPRQDGADAALFRSALTQLTEGLIVTDADGRIVYVNDIAARLHGVAPLGVPPEKYAESYHLLTEDGRPYPSTELPLARAVLREEVVIDERWRICRPDGSQLVALGSAQPLFDDDGRRIGAVLTVRDDTARLAVAAERDRLVAENQAVRERLGRVLAQTPAAVAVLTGPDHVVQSANEMFMRLFGRRDYVGLPARVAAPELIEQGFIELMDGVYRSGVAHKGREAVLVWDRDGNGTLHEGFFDFVYQPIFDAEGAIEGILVFAVEVTSQLRARQEVERLLVESEVARAEADAANRAKGEFLAVMSHELRTPLNAIGGYAELMELGIRGPVNDQQRDDLRRIQSSQRHLLGLINEVLDYAKLETGSVHFDIGDVPVREALTAAEALISPQVRAKGLRLTVGECPPGLMVRADEEKFRQILVNLISNAVKFTDRGGAVELSCVPSEGAARLTVRDTGIGIPADKLEAIFEPFVQVRSDLTRAAEGTGLGLAISRDLARAMGGDLVVQRSIPGEGSTFLLTLPLASPR